MIETITGVRPPRFTEHAAERIQRRVAQKTHGQVRHLTVTICSGTVCLGGQCKRYYIKQLASLAALEVCTELTSWERFEVSNAIEVF